MRSPEFMPRWTVAILAGLIVGAGAGAKPQAPNRRAAPPTSWDKATAGTFYDDAFGQLTGQRPDFAATSGRSVAPPGPGGGTPASGPTQGDTGGGFKWSALISGETLEDEIKEQRELVVPTVASPSTFKGGGYKQARDSFSMLALAFGLIAAHDQDVRWKKDAVAARDLFARAGFNCKTATDQGFNESRLRVEDLQLLLNGNAPKGKPDRDDDFKWSQTAARPALMARLELAEKAMASQFSAEGEFKKSLDLLVHEVEIMAAIGEAIGLPDFEGHDDDSYLEFAHAMRDAAVRVREACQKKDYAAARSAAGEISKACNGCHEGYR
jgi:hypothetical protein